MSQQAQSEPRIALLFEKFSGFVEGYAENLSLGGMFLETEEQRAKGSIVDFEIKLTDGFRLMYGLGEVVWIRRTPAGPHRPAGLGIRFQALDDNGRELILRILEERVRAGLEPFDVEVTPDDAAIGAKSGGMVIPDLPASGGTPEPLPEVPEPGLAAPEPVPPAPALEAEPDAAAPGLLPDVEQRILGEDGFTLLDSQQQAEPGIEAIHNEAFEELEFDAPWGAALPELPVEVLEGDMEPGLMGAGAAPDDAFGTAEPPAAPPMSAPADSSADEDVTLYSPASENLAAAALPDLDDAMADLDDAMADPDLSAADTDFGRADTDFGAVDTDLGAMDTDLGAADTDFGAAEAEFGATAADFAVTDADFAAAEADLAAVDADFGATDTDFDVVAADFGEAAPEFGDDLEPEHGGEQPEDALEASLFLAAEAAEEIDLAPPPGEALSEPDFDDIDFGAPVEADEHQPAESHTEGGRIQLSPGAPAAQHSPGAPPARSDSGSAGADFTFELDPSDQLPSLKPEADEPFALEAEDATVIGTGTTIFEEPTLLTSEPLAPADESSFADLVGEEDATVVGAGTSSFEEPSAEAAPRVLESEPALDSDFEIPGGEARPGAMPDPGTAMSELPPPAPQPPVVEPPAPPAGSRVEPAAPPLSDAAESVAAAGAPTVTVGGAPVQVQDYEDDLFAEESGAGPGQVVRQALRGSWLAAVAALLALAVVAFFFRGPLAELVGLSEAPEGRAGSAQTEGHAAGGQTGETALQAGGGPPPVGEPGPTAPSAEAPPDAADSVPAIEEVEVAETLLAGDAVASDPQALPGSNPPATEVATSPLARSTSAASRVEKISWRRSSDGTRVTVMLDGNLDDDRYRHMPLGYNPAKEMVTISGILEPYASGRLDVGSPEVAQIRTGHHATAGGAEIRVVFDYPSAGSRVIAVRNLGDRLEILIAGP